MAFAQQAAKQYPFRAPGGNARTWMYGGGNGTTTGLFITSPISIFIETYGSSFDSGTATMQFATDNATWANLGTSIAFTANGTATVAAADLKTGYYRVNLTGTAGTASNLVTNLIVAGSTDAL